MDDMAGEAKNFSKEVQDAIFTIDRFSPTVNGLAILEALFCSFPIEIVKIISNFAIEYKVMNT